MRKARDKSGSDRVRNDSGKRNCRCRSLERTGEYAVIHDDQVRLDGHDLTSERSKAVLMALCRIALHDQIFTLYVPQSPQLLEKASNPKRSGALGQVGGGNAGMNERNAELLRATLRQSGR